MSSIPKGATPRDLDWMDRALALAHEAREAGEVPVGAVLVGPEGLLGEGWNRPVGTHDATAHAEIVAIRRGGEALGNYRLPGTTLYVTLEPCSMCAGAIILARVQRVVYGAADPRTGAAGSVFDILGDDRLNHRPEVLAGVRADESGEALREFFASRR